MSNVVPIVKENIPFSPFYFYTKFLKEVANFYSRNREDIIEFKLIEYEEIAFSGNKFFIDPISIPLILSLCQQLKKHHNCPIPFYLSNSQSALTVLEFLFRSDFFYLSGNNKNPSYPLGRDIFNFESVYLGAFKNNQIRTQHKVRCYTLNDNNFFKDIHFDQNEEKVRDFLVEHYTFKVKEHFYELLFENDVTHHLTENFIEILAELITNGVLHSKSEAFALMFSDRFKTKFSISDNGIGLYESIKNKNCNQLKEFYSKFTMLNDLSKSFPLRTDDEIKFSVLSIFETLHYSMLKDRQGLFDLMCNVVIACDGYFRLHTNNAQIIVSARMLPQLQELHETRNEIIDIHNKFLFDLINEKTFSAKMKMLSEKSKSQIITLAHEIFKKYNEDTKYSALRLFEVKFKGVHIEVEIPNIIDKPW